MSKDQFCEWLDGFLINIEADKKASLDYDIANQTDGATSRKQL